MQGKRSIIALVVWCFVLSGCFTSLMATYYLDTLFPIGLTGLGLTGWDCPYQSKGWEWKHDDKPEQNEQDLIDDLGVNCIGCEDAQARYIGYTDPNATDLDDYIHKVCKRVIDKNMTVNYNPFDFQTI